jgi:hypothetical protein
LPQVLLQYFGQSNPVSALHLGTGTGGPVICLMLSLSGMQL